MDGVLGPTSTDRSATPDATTAGGATGRMVTVFRSRLRPDVSEDYGPVAAEMEALARAMPGFVDFKTFEASDGERVSIVVFDSRETHDAWRVHPGHRRAQELGRRQFYEQYSIHVCLETSHRQMPARP